jgi:voltage-dependent potassium channel beta subunit
MNYRSLGRCGTKVSELGLGGWMTFGRSIRDQKLARQIITTAYSNGINFFDIADVYAHGEAEKMMGKVLAEFPRHTLVISTKIFWPMSDEVNDRGLSRKHIMESIDKSLARIGADYVDIYFCHRWDQATPLEETARAMDDVIRQGKALYWGTSEWSAAQIQQAVDFCEAHNLYKPQVEQPQYNLLERKRFEQEIAPAVKKNGMGLVVWSPLASGLLTGKYDEGLPKGARLTEVDWLKDEVYKDDKLNRTRQFRQIADDVGLSRPEIALAWCLRRPEVSSVITGATHVEQLEQNLKALEIADKLNADVLKRLDGIFSLQ